LNLKQTTGIVTRQNLDQYPSPHTNHILLIDRKENTNMQARGPLMIEHRLIERMLSVIQDALVEMESEGKVGR
jgi:hypothetical protein